MQAVALHSLALAESSPVFANSKTVQATCDVVWPAMLSVVTKNGFVPKMSDRAGGILQARSGAQSKYRGATNDMKALTVNRSNFWTAPDRFMIQGVAVTVAPAGTTCSVTMQVQYAALKTSMLESIVDGVENGRGRPLVKNWVGLQSNGRLEWMMLAEIDHFATGAGKPSLAQDDAGSPVRQEVTASNVVAHTAAPTQQEAPTTQPAMPSPKSWEIVSIEGKIVDSNGSVCHYAWRISIKNNTDHDLRFAATVAFVDRDGSSVDSSEVVGLRVAPHAQQEFTGAKMMMVDSAQTVVRPQAQISEQ
jgi:hypothetical protein